MQDLHSFIYLESRLETTESAPSEHHPGEKQFTGENTSEPHRRGGAWMKGVRRKQGDNGAARGTKERRDAREQGERQGARQRRGIEK